MASLAQLPPTQLSVESPAEGARLELPALTESILLRLTTCHSDDGRRRLQQEVMLLNLGLADGIAARYAGRGVDRDDLEQVARVGLLKAVLGYQPGKGAGFTAYASPTIAGEIKRHFRDYVWMVRPPRRLQELHSKIRVVEPGLRQRLNGTPSAVELAHALGVEPQELAEALTAAGGYRTMSLDEPTHADSGLSLGDALPDDDDAYTAVERAEWLRPALARLTDGERQVIELRFVEDLSQAQIGLRLGVTQMHISRLLVSILSQLRDGLEFTEAPITA